MPVESRRQGPVRFALIGCGKVTERLALPQLRRCPDARVVALVDTNREVARRVARLFHLPDRLVWTDWKRMLRSLDADAVAVCLPNALHAGAAIAALEAGKHVMVEKPIATTLSEADAMIRAAERSGGQLMVEQTLRFDPMHEVAHGILRRGELGAVTHLRGYLGHAGPEYWTGEARSWFIDKRRSGGGALIDVGAHLVDLLLWLGDKRVKRLCCQAGTLRKRVRVEDNAGVLLEFTDGTFGSFEVSWTTRPYEVSTVFYGERGTLRTRHGVRRPLVVSDSDVEGDPSNRRGGDRYPPVPKSSREGGAYARFARCIREGRPVSPSGREGRTTLAVLLAAYESARLGAWVELPAPRAAPRRTPSGRGAPRGARGADETRLL